MLLAYKVAELQGSARLPLLHARSLPTCGSSEASPGQLQHGKTGRRASRSQPPANRLLPSHRRHCALALPPPCPPCSKKSERGYEEAKSAALKLLSARPHSRKEVGRECGGRGMSWCEAALHTQVLHL